MKKQSAGLLLYQWKNKKVEVLLGHPGGPFWAKKDKGAWSIPKGEFTEGEVPLEAAKREFSEEMGRPAPEGNYTELGTIKLSSGKLIYAWALEADLAVSTVRSNTFSMEWPPKSGQMQEFPEIDRAMWIPLDAAAEKMHTGQAEFLARLRQQLKLSAAEVPQSKAEPSQQAALF